MSNSSEADGPFESIARPLRFAARRKFANLEVLRNLEGSLLDGVERLKEGSPSRDEQQILDAIRKLAKGIDDQSAQERKARATQILALIDGPGKEPKKKGRKRESTTALAKAAPEPEKKTPTRRVRMEHAEPGMALDRVIGVGPKTAERFAKKGLVTVQDALFFVPRRYEDRSRMVEIGKLEAGQTVSVCGEVVAGAVRYAGRGRRIFELGISDGTGTLSCRFFQFRQAAMEKRYARGQRVVVSGTVGSWGAMLQMVHPDIELISDEEDATPQGIIPIYGEIEGVPQKKVRKILVGLAEVAAHKISDPLPEAMRADLAVPDLAGAIRSAHLPPTSEGLEGKPWAQMRRRLVFDELFFFQLALAVTRSRRDQDRGLTNSSKTSWEDLATDLFPFSLTTAQRRAAGEIADDLKQPRPMNRLLQGDVGCGKTAIALLSAALVKAAGRQSALLVPTEILAEQHFRSAQSLLAGRGISVALLTGSTRQKARRQLLEDLAEHRVDLVIGTHALLEPDIRFADLGLGIVDEQHRFGVEQRAKLRRKRSDIPPDILVMTATPIPRTLALTVYGDLRVTIIDELPPGRTQTQTRLFRSDQTEEAYRVIQTEIEEGRQAYVVYPLVEASEKLDLKAATDSVHDLVERFRPRKVELLHGRMRAEEKSQVMARFVSGESSVLVSTTVIEVGVDVANATVMVVEGAERFGLSQIHQLRGRVGRGAHRGRCLLVSGSREEAAWTRLHVLESTSDGFEVAERDLEIRGQGEVLGTRQSGMPDLVLADLVRDARVVEEARQAAFRLVEHDPGIGRPEHQGIRSEVARRFKERLELVDVG